VKLIAFCEASGDFRLVSGLVDRVLWETGLAWVVDNLDTPDVVRTWHAEGSGNDFIKIRDLTKHTEQLRERGVRVRQVRGHFDGRPGDAGSAMARKAFLFAEALSRHSPDDPIDAVVLVLDTDDERVERPRGVNAARDEALGWEMFEIICGFPTRSGKPGCWQGSTLAIRPSSNVSTKYTASLASHRCCTRSACEIRPVVRCAISSACSLC
jgi:hypothetical protein